MFCHATGYCQPVKLNRQQFFLDDNIIEVVFTTDIRRLRNDKINTVWMPATIEMHFSDTTTIFETVLVEPRGIDRKAHCDLASLMLNFKNETSPLLSPLKKLKLVGGCGMGSFHEELLLKEYLVYKLYNFLTPMSFRVRLMHLTYKDSKKKAKTYSQYAFLLEDVKDMANRNNCTDIKTGEYATENTNRQQMTMVCLFQYMIGNTDWAVQKYHNMKLVRPKNDTTARPYPVAYDFDYSGLVDAPYAVPNEQLGISSVRERLYRGFYRNMDELQKALDVFREKKDAMMFYIKNFPLISEKSKKDIINYLGEFYATANDKRMVKQVFMTNAREN